MLVILAYSLLMQTFFTQLRVWRSLDRRESVPLKKAAFLKIHTGRRPVCLKALLPNRFIPGKPVVQAQK